MQTPSLLVWEQMSPAQRLRVIAILVQMLLRQLIVHKEAEDERGE